MSDTENDPKPDKAEDEKKQKQHRPRGKTFGRRGQEKMK